MKNVSRISLQRENDLRFRNYEWKKLIIKAFVTYTNGAGLVGFPMQDLPPQVLSWQHESPPQLASVKQFCSISSIVHSLRGIISTAGHDPVTPSEIC